MDMKIKIKDINLKEIELIKALIEANKDDYMKIEFTVLNGSLTYNGYNLEVVEEKDENFYIDYLDKVLKAWINEDIRSVEEFYKEFYSELHPELDVDNY